MTARRISPHGAGRPVAFTFDGQALSGGEGDTIASALLANGVRVVGRSFKYHRPRGIVGAGAEEPNAIIDVTLDPARCDTDLDAPTDPDEPADPGQPADLTADAYKVRGLQQVDLRWSGLDGAVHVLRDGVRVTSSPLSGTSWTDAIGARGGGTYRYRVCLAAEPTVCTPEVTVTF